MPNGPWCPLPGPAESSAAGDDKHGPGRKPRAMATEFTLGAGASCSDGSCGQVIRTILNPATRCVTHLVIEPRHHAAAGRLVPVELVEGGVGEIRLRCSLAEFDMLEPAEQIDLAEGIDYGGYVAPEAVMGYGEVGGMGVGMGLGYPTPPVTSDNVPEGESEVVRHERIHAADGEIGRLKGFAVDPDDHRVTHVLVREGHLWGRKEVAIPVSAVSSLDDGIWLNLTKKQVEELPPRN
jgi:sporulation protein YlmC with PRC-barrel domain